MSDGKKYDNSGALFVNDKKVADNHPSHTGSALIDGVEYWLNAWVKEGAKGKFMSVSFRRKDEQQGGGKPATTQRTSDPDFF